MSADGAAGAAGPTAAEAGGPSLDELLEALEATLQRLADPSAPLDRAVADYEKARGLLGAAEERLEVVRRQVAEFEPGRD
jgi:exodeoxyribonuclease VII small subunit